MQTIYYVLYLFVCLLLQRVRHPASLIIPASENETPCFVKFSAAFSSSHSNVKLMLDNIRRYEKRQKALNFVYLTFS